MTYGNVNVDSVTTSTPGGVLGAGNASTMKNRIINGAMVIDQRNAGASVTANNAYTVDRWIAYNSAASKYTVQQNAGSVTPPVGFTNYLGLTSSSAYSVGAGDYFFIGQLIEGFNTADLQWGTANAKTVTLSFWVYSSLTGTFGGTIQSASSTRSYPYSYTVSTANTWTQISVTIPGDTTGTWLTNNGVGIGVYFAIGVGSTFSGTAGSWSGSNYFSATGAVSVVGTSGATFYVTGVQLEVGSVATGFEYRQFSTELVLCQRYFEKTYDLGTAPGAATATGFIDFCGGINVSANIIMPIRYAVAKRAAPTMTGYNYNTGASGQWTWNSSGNTNVVGTPSFDLAGNFGCRSYQLTTATAWTTGEMAGHWTASAEL